MSLDADPPLATPPPHWAVFCRVIDNHGDIGFAWRLSTQLAACGQRVTLFVDDDSALVWMAPGGCAGTQTKAWPNDEDPVSPSDLPDVVIEAFGCELPLGWQAAMAHAAHPPVWINLEYFSAEDAAMRNHGLPSPVQSGPAKGLTKWFFYPGLGPDSGGLLSGPSKPGHSVCATFQTPHAWRIGVFCYEPAGMAQWLTQWAQIKTSVAMFVTAGRATGSVKHALANLPGEVASSLDIRYLPPMTQAAYDGFLSAMDLNLVRGEDSLVRAMHAGKPFLWQIYPQHDGAHWPKLKAFLQSTNAPSGVVRSHLAWNSDTPEPLPELTDALMHEWSAWADALKVNLSNQTGLAQRLRSFAASKG